MEKKQEKKQSDGNENITKVNTNGIFIITEYIWMGMDIEQKEKRSSDRTGQEDRDNE